MWSRWCTERVGPLSTIGNTRTTTAKNLHGHGNAVHRPSLSSNPLHKDRGVKAYSACCLSDLLRLFAPDAPYTSNEIQDVFDFFVKQLHLGLKGADSSYYTQYYHLLESLSTVKSVVLICDLPQSDKLMTLVFHDFFEIVKRNLPKAVEMFLVDILVALLDECQVLPVDVMDVLMKAFMDKDAVSTYIFKFNYIRSALCRP